MYNVRQGKVFTKLLRGSNMDMDWICGLTRASIKVVGVYHSLCKPLLYIQVTSVGSFGIEKSAIH